MTNGSPSKSKTYSGDQGCPQSGHGTECRMTERKKTQKLVKARLHPIWVAQVGYRYSVIYDGKLLVERSKEPEFDAARALLAKGITGKLTLLDGKTGKPRIVIDIEQLAQLCVKEGPLRFAPYESRPDRSPAAETDEAGGEGKGGLKLQARNW